MSGTSSDGWGGYRPLARKGYDHRRETQGHGTNAAKLFPRVSNRILRSSLMIQYF